MSQVWALLWLGGGDPPGPWPRRSTPTRSNPRRLRGSNWAKASDDPILIFDGVKTRSGLANTWMMNKKNSSTKPNSNTNGDQLWILLNLRKKAFYRCSVVFELRCFGLNFVKSHKNKVYTSKVTDFRGSWFPHRAPCSSSFGNFPATTYISEYSARNGQLSSHSFQNSGASEPLHRVDPVLFVHKPRIPVRMCCRNT